MIDIIKNRNGPGPANAATPYSVNTLIEKIKDLTSILKVKETANRTMGSNVLMEKYARLLLMKPINIPQDIEPRQIMRRLKGMIGDIIKNDLFP